MVSLIYNEGTELTIHRNGNGIFGFLLMTNENSSIANFCKNFPDQFIRRETTIGIRENYLIFECETDNRVIVFEIEEKDAKDFKEFIDKKDQKFTSRSNTTKPGFYIRLHQIK